MESRRGQMKKEQGVKVPRVLATTEITTRQSFKDQLSLFAEHDPVSSNKLEELHKSLFTLSDKEVIVFDGLCKLCMDAYDKDHIDLLLKIETGQDIHTPVIERQEKTTETHYRTVLSLDESKAVFCGYKYDSYWDYVFTNIKKLAYDPVKKRRLVLGKNTYIDTVPLKIDLVYEDGNILKRLVNLSPRRKGKNKEERENTGERETGKAKGKIVGFVIEFYKPLFFPVIETSKKNTQGKAYIRQPPFFHLGIIDEMRKTANELKIAEEKIEPALKIAIYDGVQNGTILKEDVTSDYLNHCIRYLQERAKSRLNNILGVSPIEIRNFFNYLALHDNGKGEYITIDNLIDFVDRCFEGLTELDRAGERRLYPSRFKELIEKKIMPILYVYKNMILRGKMDGGQLVPCNILFEDTETGEKFGRETNSLRIKCKKSKSFFSSYTEKHSKDSLINLAETPELPKMLGKQD
jgi:hypothetical protein